MTSFTPQRPETVGAIVSKWVTRQPDRPAILTTEPGRRPMSWAELGRHVHKVSVSFAATGLGLNEPIGVALPNGPELATALLATASVATCAPLTTQYQDRELAHYTSLLGCRALLLPVGECPEVRQHARRHGVAIFDILPVDGPAGAFEISGPGSSNTSGGLLPSATADDRVLMMHTSGTTSRPKVVPLTHRNVCASLAQLRTALRLSAADRSLAVMPLYHTHGLIRELLVCIAAGGSVVCARTFDSEQFFDWLRVFRPSYYSAAPAIHAEVAELADMQPTSVRGHMLRFVGSSSAPLPVHLFERLEESLGVPVIDSYGLTETGPLLSCNPLPPGSRKPGSVGLPLGCELRIESEAGASCAPETMGEITVRGPNVFHGYLNDPDANREAFLGGWFRTGDLGSLDRDGYLFVRGRVKEIINRGGEKISPQEIEDALNEHDAVLQAAAFPIGHQTLGQVVSAAVVLKARAQTTEAELRRFVAEYLARSKVPDRIMVVDELPRTATGKIKRGALAQLVTASLAEDERDRRPDDEPFTPLEETIASVWQEVLGVVDVRRADNFMLSGGDSLTATRVSNRVADQLKVRLEMADFFDHPTFRELVAHVERRLAE